MADRHNVVLIGGTGTGKTHLAIAIIRAFAIGLEPMAPRWPLRTGTRGRFYTIVQLVNRLETETRADTRSALHAD